MLIKDKKSAGRIIVILSLMSMLAGLVAALISTPYITSTILTDVTGAGMSFITGAVLIGAGLVALSNVIGDIWRD